MYDAYLENMEKGALKVLELQYAKSSAGKDSKLTKVLKNKRLAMTLMRDILPLGPHYRMRHELSVRWLEQAVNRCIQYICSSRSLY
ncbi:hypothetical protein BDR07DRAFT_1394389 [Suillus spraguei]|nr:hypothetical protein BDR07DRAFT_1394389 [Suillus spraguei]